MADDRSERRSRNLEIKIAREASVDPRTVRKFRDGGDVRPRGRERIEGAIERLGLSAVVERRPREP